MNQLEQNIMNSFRLAKGDIIKLQSNVIQISRMQKRVLELMNELNEKEVHLYERMKEVDRKASRVRKTTKVIVKEPVKEVKTVLVKRHRTEFVATDRSKIFHVKICPFAQNIKPKNKIKFKSRVKALNEGFKACKCIKKRN